VNLHFDAEQGKTSVAAFDPALERLSHDGPFYTQRQKSLRRVRARGVVFAALSLTRLRDACSLFLSNRGKTHRMNKIAHGIVLAWFGVACWLVWALLQLPLMVRLPGVELHLPAFTRFCMAVGPFVVIGLATLAAAYCVWVWCRKTETRASWVGFLATATGSLFLVTLPIVLAIYLPLVNALQHVQVK